jgi:superfamily II DNA or RNA helicase
MPVNDVQETPITAYAAALLEDGSSQGEVFDHKLLTNSNGKRVLHAIKNELLECDHFWFSVAFLTTSGLASLKQELIELRDRKTKGKILVSQYLDFTQPEALKQLLMFDNIELRIAINTNFHAKGYMFYQQEKNEIIIGSSNLTAAALSTNTEWNLQLSTLSQAAISSKIQAEFDNEFKRATPVTTDYIENYRNRYVQQKLARIQKAALAAQVIHAQITPNKMQQTALENLRKLREAGQTKGLLISATGTGKTYLSAFDARQFNAARLLFIVHRENIAKASMESFQKVFESSKTFGLYSGSSKNKSAEYLFTTIQTISRDDHLLSFDKSAFDYIVIDETHRAQANSYQKVLKHFTPKFTLGMTATPERTDGIDIFQTFDHNIAYEIRLHEALGAGFLAPFHYYGVADISIDGAPLDDDANFNSLVCDERIKHILEKTMLYGCDTGEVRGLIFCSKVDECLLLSQRFNEHGLSTMALTGASSEDERTEAICRLESNNKETKLDYIFTVDIFNEGIDIPSVNQVVMLRPTQSAIIFVQQLGRGLRKSSEKDYLTVIDFIGNYQNNFLVPIALYGDKTFNKDRVRRAIVGGSNEIPGTSTINFEAIAKKRIFEALSSANLRARKDLKKDYQLLKFKLGRIPSMCDFFDHGERDPFTYVIYSKSYYNFIATVEPQLQDSLTSFETKLLELFSCQINNSKREVESVILKKLIQNGSVKASTLQKIIQNDYGYELTNETIYSSIHNLNFKFVTEKVKGKLLPVGDARKLDLVAIEGEVISFKEQMKTLLTKEKFKTHLLDSTLWSIAAFSQYYESSTHVNGFNLYQKYSRKDVFRILNWNQNPVAQNVGGYIVSKDKTNCPIFVNYHKEEGISDSTQYEDRFISKSIFQWMSKSRRTLTSPDVSDIRDATNLGLRLPLFVKKHNDEGAEFYYMGDLIANSANFEQTTMPSGEGKTVSVVKVAFEMLVKVRDDIYRYLVS